MAGGAPKGGPNSARRGMPVDILVEHFGHAAPQQYATRADADADYFGNLKKFERHDNMAAYPTRNKAGEPKSK